MSVRIRPFAVASVVAGCLMSAAFAQTTQPADRKEIAAALTSAVGSGSAEALASVRARLEGTHSGERFDQAQRQVDPKAREAALLALADDLAFEPTSEALTPEGWPAYTPIGEIELKAYPAYRSATTSRVEALPDSLMFWKLFIHIQRNNISMTAPVEMTMSDPKDQEMQSMGFLYVSDEIGKPGTEGVVTVVDVPAQLAVSIGLRGEMDKKAIADAAARIDAWLAERADEYEPAGDYRVMGYNSPSMPDEKKFYEVQRVVTKKEETK